MPLAQVGLDFVVKNVSYAMGRSQRYISMLGSIVKGTEQVIAAKTRENAAYQRSASTQQIAVIATEKARTKESIARVGEAKILGLISREDSYAAKEALRLQEKVTLGLLKQSDGFKALETEEQRQLIKNSQLITQQKRFYAGLTALSTATAIYTAAMIKLGKASVDVATRTQVLSRGLATVSGNFGITEKQANKTVQAMQNMQVTEDKAVQTLSRLTAVGISSSQALQVVSTANDVAAGRGQDFNLVLDSMVDALENVTNTSLRQIGLVAPATEIYEVYAQKVGKAVKALTEQDKRLAILDQELRQGAVYTGAYTASLSAQDQQMRRLNVEVNKLAKTFGSFLLPTVTKLTAKTVDFVAVLNNASPAAQELAARVITVVTAVGSFSASLFILSPIIKLIVQGFKLLAAPKHAVVLLGLSVAVGYLANKFVTTNEAVQELKDSLTEQQEKSTLLEEYKKQIENVQAEFEALVAEYEDGANKIIASTELLKRPLQDALYDISLLQQKVADGFYDIEQALRNLDRPLWPLEDALKRIQAQIAPIVIPLERANRTLQRQLEDIQDYYEEEKERAASLKEELEDQVDVMEDLLEIDRDRLKSIQQDIFMEELRNKILRRTTSGRLLELKSAAALAADEEARKQKEIDTISEITEEEEDQNSAYLQAIEDQISAVEKQIEGNERQIDLQQEMVTYQQEEIELAKAAQVEDRIRFEQEQRFLTDKQTALAREEDLINRQIAAYDNIIEQQKRILEDMESIKELGLESPVINNYLDLKELALAKQSIEYLTEQVKLYNEELAKNPPILVPEEKEETAWNKFLDGINIRVERTKKLWEVFKYNIDVAKQALKNFFDLLIPSGFVAEKIMDALVKGFNVLISPIKSISDLIKKIIDNSVGLQNFFAGIASLRDFFSSTTAIDIANNLINRVIDSSPVGTGNSVSPLPVSFRGSTVNNNSYTTVGPTVQVDANYSRTQSSSSVAADVQLLLALV